LIEIVRNGDMSNKDDIMAAITFAAQQLAPRASKDPAFVEDLNYGMCLVVFNKDKLQPDVQKLLDKDLRSQIAGQVNDAILRDSNESPENKLLSLLKARLWSELKCREMRKNIPDKIPLGLSPDELIDTTDDIHGNGDADVMVQ
jgi:glucose-induced degradation protein 8